MKLILITVLAILTTGCAMSPERMATYHPQPSRWSEYHDQGSVSRPQMSTVQTQTSVPAAYPRAQTIITNSGNYVIVPNYSTGGISAVLGPQ